MSHRTASSYLVAIKLYQQVIDANRRRLAELEDQRPPNARRMRERLIATNADLAALIQSLEIDMERAERPG